MKVKELAEILELSPATVSLVLNNRPGISEATRKKVKDAVIELGCEDMMNIKEKKKKTLLFVVYRKNATDDKFQRFSQLFSEIIEGVESQAKLKNFQLMLSYVMICLFKKKLCVFRISIWMGFCCLQRR